MNKAVIITAAGVAAVVAGTWALLRPPSEQAVLAEASLEKAAAPAAAPANRGSVQALEPLQAKSPVKITPGAPRPVVPLKSQLAQEYEKARQLKPFYDRYAANPEAADGETRFFAALALERCIARGRGASGATEAEKARFQARLKDNDPNAAIRQEAFNRITEACEGFAGMAITPADISKLYREAAAQGNAAAKAAVAGDLYREQSRNARSMEERRMTEEQLGMLREALATGDPFALERAGQLLTWGSAQLHDRRIGPTGDPYVPRDWSQAWQLAACDRGANCGADSYRVLNGCAYQGACGYDNLEAYLQFNELPPNAYAATLANRGVILDAIAQGRWDWLGIAPGMGRVIATPVANAPGGQAPGRANPPAPRRGG